MYPPDRQSMTIRHRPQPFRPWLEEFERRDCPSVTLYTYGDQTNLAGDTVSVAVSGAASDSSALTYGETGMPPGVTFDISSGLFSGTINNNAASGTPYSVTVTATSSTAGSASSSFNWTVNPPVVTLYGPGDQTNLGGDTVSTSAYGSSSDGYAVTYAATGLPPDLSIDSSSGIISGTIPNNAASGTPWSVTITATDASSGVSADVTLDWTVNPPVVTLYGPGDQTNLGGDTVSTSAYGSSSDGYAVTYSETGLPPGLNLDTSTGAITGTITPSAWSSTPYAVTITATAASSGVSATASSDWTVNPPVVSLYGLGSQIDQAGDNVDTAVSGSSSDGYAVTYGATGLPPGLTSGSGSGVISGVIDAWSATPYAVTITATDASSGVSASANFDWTVNLPSAPVASDQAVSTLHDTALLDISFASDLSGFALTPIVVAAPSDGQAFQGADGQLEYVPNAGWTGTDSFTVMASNGFDDSNVAIITVTVANGTFVWTGAGSDNLGSDPLNWSGDAAPIADDFLIFNSTSSKDAYLDSAFTSSLASVEIDAGYTGNIILQQSFTVTSSLMQAGGTIVLGSNNI